MPRVLLADDHLLVRDTIAAYLSSSGDFEVETAQDLTEAIDLLKSSSRIELGIFDYEMPGMNGLDGLARVRAAYPDLIVTVISGVANAKVATDAFELGARGYFPKSITVTEMLAGVRRVLAGELVDDLFEPAADATPTKTVRDSFGLTSREFEILKMLALGHSNKLIASELDLKEVTVKFHVSNVMSKLGVTNRTQAALIARQEILA